MNTLNYEYDLRYIYLNLEKRSFILYFILDKTPKSVYVKLCARQIHPCRKKFTLQCSPISNIRRIGPFVKFVSSNLTEMTMCPLLGWRTMTSGNSVSMEMR